MTRFIWPAPTPRRAPSRATTMAFDLTWRTTRQAKARSASSRASGARALTTRHAARVVRLVVRLGHEQAATGAADLEGRPRRHRRQDGAVHDQAEVRLGGQPGARRLVEAGRHHDLQEEAREGLGQRAVHAAAHRHDAPEGAHRVARQGTLPGREQVGGLRSPTGDAVLDDDDRVAPQVARQRRGGGGVEQVVVRERLAGQERGTRGEGAGGGVGAGRRVESRSLVGVFAVAQQLGAAQTQAEPLREALLRRPAAPTTSRRWRRRRRP